jgi:hypothetical protein
MQNSKRERDRAGAPSVWLAISTSAWSVRHTHQPSGELLPSWKLDLNPQRWGRESVSTNHLLGPVDDALCLDVVTRVLVCDPAVGLCRLTSGLPRILSTTDYTIRSRTTRSLAPL